MIKVSNSLIDSLSVNTWHYGTIIEVATDETISNLSIGIEMDEVECILKKTMAVDCLTDNCDFLELVRELEVINEEGRVYFDELLFKDVAIFLTESTNGKLFIESIQKDTRTDVKKYHLIEVDENDTGKRGKSNEI